MYKDIENKTEEIIKTYYQKGETAKAIHIQYKGNTYKSVQFRKKGFGKNYYILKGVLYLTEKDEIVKDNNLLEEIEKLTYYYKSIFNVDNKNSIVSSYEDDSSINRYEDDSNRAISALEFLKDDGMEEALKLKEVIIKVAELRKEKNNKIKELLILEEKIKDNDYVFTDTLFIKAHSIFEEILRINFQSVKLINLWKIHYEDLIKAVRKKKRSFHVKLHREMYVAFIKLEYILSYFKRILNTYDSILDLDENTYMRYIRNKHKEIIKENLKWIRNL
ncbi:hypothetical protein KQI86_14265 [Clostridium sp. MSJ-11]|uniref:Uncharacterized protein n=1 Tax=Clostridium mobile TaxID=2841512 RepID=A0ABS6EKZ9_9CLOT|nr:hypothetical protein [Clostridium mobile]MBU5485482.1 hypothetical protein [Clostridium mobile]